MRNLLINAIAATVYGSFFWWLLYPFTLGWWCFCVGVGFGLMCAYDIVVWLFSILTSSSDKDHKEPPTTGSVAATASSPDAGSGHQYIIADK